ncbi:SMC family ATPase, partial [Pseudonocardia sp. SCN 73-27]
MRPVRLEMNGFAAFREPAVVDFTGADYFALVGPTGAGKSTVVDALCFALYGSVPRWDDRRAVRLGLAPHVSRGVVRLVFDVAGARYVAARELRRSAQDKVTVRSARLELLADPDELDGDSRVLAADSGVTPEVERLLGLPFDQFCQCVVLPQGAFAEFLHAKPADRQKMLVRLLGLDVYEAIAREANREAAASGERADVLAGQLGAYDDATADAVAAATARVDALGALADRVTAATERLGGAAAAVVAAESAVATSEGERAVLAGITVPADAADVDARRRSAAEASAAAARAVAEAGTADAEARSARDAAPSRGPLEQARRDHADLAAARDARPGAAAAHD